MKRRETRDGDEKETEKGKKKAYLPLGKWT